MSAHHHALPTTGGRRMRNYGFGVVAAVALFIWGLFYFRKTERRFADIT